LKAPLVRSHGMCVPHPTSESRRIPSSRPSQ
jgi:hypothetical protein